MALEEWRHWLEENVQSFNIFIEHKNLKYLKTANIFVKHAEPPSSPGSISLCHFIIGSKKKVYATVNSEIYIKLNF